LGRFRMNLPLKNILDRNLPLNLKLPPTTASKKRL
jgi:hypothetical protein